MTNIQSSTFKLHPRMRHRRVGDESVVVSMQTGDVLVVNEVAGFVLSQLEVPVKFEQLISNIIDQYEVELPTAERDLNNCLEDFLSNDIVIAVD